MKLKAMFLGLLGIFALKSSAETILPKENKDDSCPADEKVVLCSTRVELKSGPARYTYEKITIPSNQIDGNCVARYTKETMYHEDGSDPVFAAKNGILTSPDGTKCHFAFHAASDLALKGEDHNLQHQSDGTHILNVPDPCIIKSFRDGPHSVLTAQLVKGAKTDQKII